MDPGEGCLVELFGFDYAAAANGRYESRFNLIRHSPVSLLLAIGQNASKAQLEGQGSGFVGYFAGIDLRKSSRVALRSQTRPKGK